MCKIVLKFRLYFDDLGVGVSGRVSMSRLGLTLGLAPGSSGWLICTGKTRNRSSRLSVRLEKLGKLKLFVQQYQTHRRSFCISLLVLNSHSRANFWYHWSLYTSCVSMIRTCPNSSLPSNLVKCHNKWETQVHNRPPEGITNYSGYKNSWALR